MKKYSYVGVSFIVLIFGIIFVPKIVDRVKDTKIVSNNRVSADNKITNEKLSYLLINDVKKTIPEFAFRNQDSLLITQHDFKGCLLYTSPSPRDKRQSRMPSSA